MARSAKIQWLNEIASLYKMLYKMQLASKSPILLACSGVGDLKIPRRKACRFDSGPGHQRKSIHISVTPQLDSTWLFTTLKLWAISDLHVGAEKNRRALSALSDFPDDWLILAGDVCERIEDLEWVFSLYQEIF